MKLLGMQMLIEGLAIAAFNVMHKQTSDPTLRDLLDYVLQDEGRHVNFGYFALRRAVPYHTARRLAASSSRTSRSSRLRRDVRTRRQDRLSAVEGRCGTEMGLDGEAIWRDGIVDLAHAQGVQPLPVHRGADPAAPAARADVASGRSPATGRSGSFASRPSPIRSVTRPGSISSNAAARNSPRSSQVAFLTK